MKNCFIAVLLFGLSLFGRDYSYTEHFPVLPQPWYFASPSAIDVGPGGNLYVLHSNNKVSVFTAGGVFLRQYVLYYQSWNGMVSRSLKALAVDPSGNMYLADVLEHVLLKVDVQGNIVNKFSFFNREGDLETDTQGNLYFADTNANEDDPIGREHPVHKFDPQGNILLEFGAPAYSTGDAALWGPRGIFIGNDGTYYISDSKKIKQFNASGQYLRSIDVTSLPFSGTLSVGRPIYVYNGIIYALIKSGLLVKLTPTGELLGSFGHEGSDPSGLGSISELALVNDKIYFSDRQNQWVSIFSLDGVFISGWQSMGHNQKQFWNPKRVWVDNPGNVYVCDTGNNRIQKFDRKWNLDMVFGSEGTGAGQFKNPSGVYVDDEGSIYVADKDNYRVQKFDKKGQFLFQWGTQGTGNGQFQSLMDIDGDRDGYIYVLDGGGTKGYVQKFSRTGQFAAKFSVSPSPDLWDVRGIGVNNNGLIYVAESSANLYIYDTQGNFVGYIPDELKLDSPLDAAVSPTGDIFVADSKKGVAQFNPDGTFVAYLAAGTDVLKDVYIPTGVAVHNTGRLYICEEANGRVLVYEPKAGLKMTVPAAASIRGALGTDWRTDLSIFNPGSSAIDVTLDYYKADGPLSYAFTLQPSSFLSLPDVIGSTFNAPNTFGALTAVCLNEDQPLIFSRTYNLTEQGTYGQGIRGSPYGATFYEGDNAFLTGLKNTDAFRSNVGFFNLQDIPIEVQLVLYDEAGVELASTSYPLAALSHLQVNNIFSSLSLSGDHEAAWARVWTDTLWGRFTSYGSIVDNRTGDPVYLEAKPLGGYMPEDFHWILPAVASTPGAYGTNWRTETVFTNSLLESNEITLTYHPVTGGDPFVETFTLEPGEVKSYADFLGEAFALDESFGWLEIDSSCAGLQARARIFTGETGTYGQGLQAQQQNTLSFGTSPVYLLNLLENENYRSNLGLLNLSDTEMIFTLDLLKDAAVVSSKTLTLSAQTLQQLNGVLSSFFETSGDSFTVKITGPEGAIYTAYLSTVDNRTGDAVYQSFSSQ
jgi:sugar lactone lactonase YvrE